jgi:hypothetical protein
MPAPTATPDADTLFRLLEPELKKLCRNAAPFCELTLKATLHDGDVGRIALGIETSRKVTPRADRGRV